MSKFKETNDYVGDKNNVKRTNAYANFRFINGNSDKNGSTLMDLSHADIPHADASTSEDSEHNASSIDATTTLGSTDEADSLKSRTQIILESESSCLKTYVRLGIKGFYNLMLLVQVSTAGYKSFYCWLKKLLLVKIRENSTKYQYC
nr:hypothetical protein [Tanacetum cinerariifolium]